MHFEFVLKTKMQLNGLFYNLLIITGLSIVEFSMQVFNKEFSTLRTKSKVVTLTNKIIETLYVLNGIVFY